VAIDAPEPLPVEREHLRPFVAGTFERTLEAAKFHRDERPGADERGIPLCVVYERQCMFFELNRQRVRVCKQPLHMEDVIAVEDTDAAKFALRCAGLVLDTP
jgi:hypothetical protein